MSDKILKIKIGKGQADTKVFLNETEVKMVQSVKVEMGVGQIAPKATIEAYVCESDVEVLQKNTEMKVIVVGDRRKDGEVSFSPKESRFSENFRKLLEKNIRESVRKELKESEKKIDKNFFNGFEYGAEFGANITKSIIPLTFQDLMTSKDNDVFIGPKIKEKEDVKI